MARRIDVAAAGSGSFRVTVSERGGETAHSVSVDAAYASKLAGDASTEDLVRTSFEFLLAREPKEAILASFDLPTIARYFPEYETEMRQHFR